MNFLIPNLCLNVRDRYAPLITWSGLPAAGTIMYSQWPSQWPQIDMAYVHATCCLAYSFISFFRLVKKILELDQYKHFLNASRCDPTRVIAIDPYHNYLRERGTIYLKNPRRIAIFFSIILVQESHVTAPTLTSNGVRVKFIKGALHSQEMERLASFVVATFGKSTMGGQIDKNYNMSFQTIPLKDDGPSNTSNANTPSDQSNATKQESSHIRSNTLLRQVNHSTRPQHSRSSFVKTSLASTDISTYFIFFILRSYSYTLAVPVYHIKGYNFKFPEDLEDLSKLPRWTGEVPLGSCALVGYTSTMFKSAGKELLQYGANVQFVIILAS